MLKALLKQPLTPYAREAIRANFKRYATTLNHDVAGTDVLLLVIMTPGSNDKGSTQPMSFLFKQFGLSRGDVYDAIVAITDHSNAVSKSKRTKAVDKVFDVSKKVARARARSTRTSSDISRFDIFVALFVVYDVTFEAIMEHLVADPRHELFDAEALQKLRQKMKDEAKLPPKLTLVKS